MSENNTNKYVNRAGSFRCVVQSPSSGWFEETSKGTPFIRIPCEVVEDGDQKGKLIAYSAYLSDAAFDRNIKTLSEVFGWDGDLVKLKNGEHSFAGQECRIVCESETYEGEVRVKAQWLNSVAGPAREGMAKEKVDSLIARLGSKARALAKATPGAAAPAAAPAATGSGPAVPDDDDIPFAPNVL